MPFYVKNVNQDKKLGPEPANSRSLIEFKLSLIKSIILVAISFNFILKVTFNQEYKDFVKINFIQNRM